MNEVSKGEPWSDAPQIVLRLSNHLNSFDWTEVETICMDLIKRLNNASIPFPLEAAKEILRQLRRKRRFRLMERVADALIRSGQSGAQLRRQYAQAMIDQDNLTAPERELQAIIGDQASPASERAEAEGLLGRIYKQLYVNTNDPHSPRQQENLRRAIAYYYDVYRRDPKEFLWQGINTVALLRRAHWDKVAVGYSIDDRQLAKEILDAIANKPDAHGVFYWDRATAVEASVALGRLEDARDQLIYFVSDPAVDAFEVGSLFRQLTEVWGLRPTSEPGASLLPVLRAALLAREGGQMDLDRTDVQAGLEAVFGKDRYEPFSWFQTGLQRCTAVARIETILGKRVGTGFLVDPHDFFESPGDDPVLLTNAHVISPREHLTPPAIAPDVAVAVFEALGQRYRVKKLLWRSPVAQLDATFVSIEKMQPDCAPCPLKPPPEPFDPKRTQRVYMIGYPLGGVLSISLQDSIWLDTDATVLHYRTPSEEGSSGSPVFDQNYWSVVALHHKGRSDMPLLKGQPGSYEANEGIAIEAIREAIRASGGRPADAH
jgi:Trypsin-like peptidase domain/MAP3K TRAFs-binding domain